MDPSLTLYRRSLDSRSFRGAVLRVRLAVGAVQRYFTGNIGMYGVQRRRRRHAHGAVTSEVQHMHGSLR